MSSLHSITPRSSHGDVPSPTVCPEDANRGPVRQLPRASTFSHIRNNGPRLPTQKHKTRGREGRLGEKGHESQASPSWGQKDNLPATVDSPPVGRGRGKPRDEMQGGEPWGEPAFHCPRDRSFHPRPLVHTGHGPGVTLISACLGAGPGQSPLPCPGASWGSHVSLRFKRAGREPEWASAA